MDFFKPSKTLWSLLEVEDADQISVQDEVEEDVQGDVPDTEESQLENTMENEACAPAIEVTPPKNVEEDLRPKTPRPRTQSNASATNRRPANRAKKGNGGRKKKAKRGPKRRSQNISDSDATEGILSPVDTEGDADLSDGQQESDFGMSPTTPVVPTLPPVPTLTPAPMLPPAPKSHPTSTPPALTSSPVLTLPPVVPKLPPPLQRPSAANVPALPSPLQLPAPVVPVVTVPLQRPSPHLSSLPPRQTIPSKAPSKPQETSVPKSIDAAPTSVPAACSPAILNSANTTMHTNPIEVVTKRIDPPPVPRVPILDEPPMASPSSTEFSFSEAVSPTTTATRSSSLNVEISGPSQINSSAMWRDLVQRVVAVTPQQNQGSLVAPATQNTAPTRARITAEPAQEDSTPNQADPSSFGDKELTPDQWREVIKRRSILCGIRMETRLNGLKGPDVSGVPLLRFDNSMIQAAYRVETSKNEGESVSGRQMNYMQAGWLENTLSATPPFVAATMKVRVERSKSENQVEASKRFHTTHTFNRVKLTIHTDEASNHLNPIFKKELGLALNITGDHQKRAELERLFEKWGHALATELVLGGERREISEGIASAEETNRRTNIQYTAEAKTSAAPAGGGASIGSSEDRSLAQKEASKQTSQSYVGGDPKYHQDAQLDSWKASIEDFNHWDVIRRERAIPIIDLLDPEHKKEILRVATPKPLLGRWLSADQLEVVSCKHYKVYQPRLSDIDLKQGWRSLGHSFDLSKALIVKAAEDHSDALHPVNATKLSWRSKRFFHSDTFWRLTPRSTEYTALGSIYAKGGFFGGAPPDEEKTKSFCSVKTAYLTEADYQKPDTHKGNSGSAGSVWTIFSPDDVGLQAGLLHAVEGTEKPAPSRMALRLDCVEFNSDMPNVPVRLGVAR